jgi:hypothetical protein
MIEQFKEGEFEEILDDIVNPNEVTTGVSYEDTIRNISFNQKEIMHNILELHCPETSVNSLGQKYFEMDFTYSEGSYYRHSKTDQGFNIPEPKYKLDVFPQRDDIMKIEPLGPLPFRDNSIESINCDLPFVISCGPSINNDDDGSCIIAKRFAYYYPRQDMFESYYHWLSESYRVLKPGGVLCFKTQSTISGGTALWTAQYSWMMAIMCGFYPKDEFILQAKARLTSSKVKKQQHARKFTSTFWVFEKGNKKDPRYFYWLKENDVEEMMNRFRNNLIKK